MCVCWTSWLPVFHTADNLICPLSFFFLSFSPLSLSLSLMFCLICACLLGLSGEEMLSAVLTLKMLHKNLHLQPLTGRSEWTPAKLGENWFLAWAAKKPKLFTRVKKSKCLLWVCMCERQSVWACERVCVCEHVRVCVFYEVFIRNKEK